MADKNEKIASPPRDRMRRAWFPLAVIALAVAWWIRRTSEMGYTTLYHVLVVIISVALLAVWFVRCGPGQKRIREKLVWAGFAAFIAWMIVFKPVWNGDMGIYRWKLRFASDPDEALAAIAGSATASDWQTTSFDYPRFLGNGYWAEVDNAALETNWTSHPPEKVWRKEIGAGWSSFAVVGNYAVTQEQRGDEELVSCYRVDNGDLVWVHSDTARFDPADFQGGLGGIGPRATPTIHDGKVITQGATGIVNCLDAKTGAVLWSHDTVEETGADVITWGKSGSPLVVDDLVIVNVGAPNDETAREDYNSSLVAYDLETGDLRWAAGNRQASYASPIVATLAGERQIVMVNEKWVTAHRVDDGKVLWEYPWADESDSNATTTQPIPLSCNRLFLSKGYGVGSSLWEVKRAAEDNYSIEPQWDVPIKRVMKTKFSNAVVRDGYVYGLDDVLLSCIDANSNVNRTSNSNAGGVKIGGSYPDNSQEFNPFNGRIDELMFFNKRLTDAEVAAQFALVSDTPGDFNLDGMVDAADYTAWRDGLGDLYVAADYEVWRSHFGQSSSPGAGALPHLAVPELHSATLAFAAFFLALALPLGPRIVLFAGRRLS